MRGLNSNHYGKLTPEERFRLSLLAFERDDMAEAERLKQTCPWKQYSMPDADVTDRIRASALVTLVFCLDLAPRISKLQMAQAFAEAVPWFIGKAADIAAQDYLSGYEAGAKAAWQAAGKKGKPKVDLPGTEEVAEGIQKTLTGVPNTIRTVAEEVAADINGHLEAFGRITRAELELEPQTLLKVWFAPIMEQLDMVPEVEPDPVQVEENFAVLCGLWKKELGN